MAETFAPRNPDRAIEAHLGPEPNAPSRESSGIDAADYEVAAQLINHAQGQRETDGHTSVELGKRLNGAVEHRDSNEASNDDTTERQIARQSTSPDGLGESQYSPLPVPPSNGQRCR